MTPAKAHVLQAAPLLMFWPHLPPPLPVPSQVIHPRVAPLATVCKTHDIAHGHVAYCLRYPMLCQMAGSDMPCVEYQLKCKAQLIHQHHASIRSEYATTQEAGWLVSELLAPGSSSGSCPTRIAGLCGRNCLHTPPPPHKHNSRSTTRQALLNSNKNQAHTAINACQVTHLGGRHSWQFQGLLVSNHRLK